MRLLNSFNTRGFYGFDPRAPLQVAALRQGKEYRWLIKSGQHRFATAAAFQMEVLPAMVTEIIRREDASFWPQVVRGVITETGAKLVFDRIFNGVPAGVCAAWIDATTIEEYKQPLRLRRTG
jgi:hypothetical protein